MRSRPYTPPPPLPPLLGDLADQLSSILPNQEPRPRPRPRSEIIEIQLADLDPDTSRLLSPPPPPAAASTRPRTHHHHHVRVQGRLALVRSVSAIRARAGNTTSTADPPVPRYESAVGSAVALPGSGNSKRRAKRGRRSRRLSLDERFRDGGTESESDGDDQEDDERRRETAIRDTQLRGYGIGGVGNIRRPMDVVHFTPSSSSSRMSSLLLFSSVAPSSPTSLTSPGGKKWNLREMFGLDRRPKAKANRYV